VSPRSATGTPASPAGTEGVTDRGSSRAARASSAALTILGTPDLDPAPRANPGIAAAPSIRHNAAAPIA
jgi:hypothetical protein